MANIIISIVGVFASVLLCILTIAINRLFKRFDEIKADLSKDIDEVKADVKAVADRLQRHEDKCAGRDIQMARLLGNLETAVTGKISRDDVRSPHGAAEVGSPHPRTTSDPARQPDNAAL